MRAPRELVEVARSAAAASQADAQQRRSWEEHVSDDVYADVATAILNELPAMLLDNPGLLAFDPRVSAAVDDSGRQEMIDSVLALHFPAAIFRECDCDEDQHSDGRHVEVEVIGMTCDVADVVCGSCCVDSEGNQSEDCADGHVHGPGFPICATVSALTKAGMCLCPRHTSSRYCPIHSMGEADHRPHPVALIAQARRHWDPAQNAQNIIAAFSKAGMDLVAPSGMVLDGAVKDAMIKNSSYGRIPAVLVWERLIEAGVTVSS